MWFNLLYLLWLVITQLLPLRFGRAADIRANGDELKRISALSLDFAVRCQIFFLLCKFFYGLDVLVVDGVRTAAEQAALHKQNDKNPLKPGDHGDGHAVDLNFFRNGVLVLRKSSTPAQWQDVYDLADWCGLENGHAFPGYPDNNHFFKRKGFFLF
jgi:hypothetical protein